MSQTLHAQLKNRQSLSRGRGLGFLAPDYADNEYGYDPYYDSYDRNDFYYGVGGDYSTPDIYPYEDWGGGYFYDPNNGVLFDPYGGASDTWGTGIFDFGDEILTTINTTEPNLYTNYDDLQNTLNWWDSIANDIGEDDLNALINDPGLHSLGGDLAIHETPPPATAPKATKQAYLKKLLEAAKAAASKVSGSSSSGGARPGSVSPNAQNQCPQGYQLNPQTKQCLKVAPASGDLFETLKNNPLYWMLGGIALILLAKK